MKVISYINHLLLYVYENYGFNYMADHKQLSHIIFKYEVKVLNHI